jgi:WD40 repeat protein
VIFIRFSAGEANCASFSSSGSKLCTGGADMRIKIWDSRTGFVFCFVFFFLRFGLFLHIRNFAFSTFWVDGICDGCKMVAE